MADITETTRRNILAAFKENGWKAEWMRTDTGREYLAIDGKPQWSMDWVGRYSGRLMKTCKWVARRRDEFDGVLRKVNELVKEIPHTTITPCRPDYLYELTCDINEGNYRHDKKNQYIEILVDCTLPSRLYQDASDTEPRETYELDVTVWDDGLGDKYMPRVRTREDWRYIVGGPIRPLEDIPALINNKRKERIEYLRELVHDINRSLEHYGNDIPENEKD